MSDIPLARKILEDALESSDQHVLHLLIRQALALMTRPPIASRRVAPPRSSAVTPELVHRIKVLARTYPNVSLQHIAFLTHTNAGRVSEVLTGRRDDNGRLVG